MWREQHDVVDLDVGVELKIYTKVFVREQRDVVEHDVGVELKVYTEVFVRGHDL
jgi:hypothetical protein